MPSETESMLTTSAHIVVYHSYLLRVRRVRDGEREQRQAYLREIPSLEEHYFNGLGELVEWLRADGRLAPKRDVDAGGAEE